MAVQEHLYFVEPAGQRAVLAGQFAIQAPAGHGREGGGRVVDPFVQAQVPAAGGDDVEAADVGEGFVQVGSQGMGLRFIDIERASVGQDDSLMVEAQVHRVGTQPVAFAGGFADRLAEQAQRAEGGVVQVELPGERRFEGHLVLPCEAGTGGQPFETGQAELAERQLVVRFGPDQFRDEQGEAHGSKRGDG